MGSLTRGRSWDPELTVGARRGAEVRPSSIADALGDLSYVAFCRGCSLVPASAPVPLGPALESDLGHVPPRAGVGTHPWTTWARSPRLSGGGQLVPAGPGLIGQCRLPCQKLEAGTAEVMVPACPWGGHPRGDAEPRTHSFQSGLSPAFGRRPAWSPQVTSASRCLREPGLCLDTLPKQLL